MLQISKVFFELNNRLTGAWFFFQSRTFNCSTQIFLIWNWKWYCLCSPNGFNPLQIPVLHISKCWSVSGDFEFSTVGSVIYTVTLDWKWKKANICITLKAKINIFEKTFHYAICRHLRDRSVKKCQKCSSPIKIFFYLSYPLEYKKKLQNLSKFLIEKLMVTIRVWLSQ